MSLARRMLVLALLVGVPVSSAVAQGAIGAVQIRLGTSKSATLARLRTLYNVQQGGTSDSWFVTTRDGPPFRVLGMVAFDGDSVTTISRSWTPANDRDPDEVGRVLVGAIRALANEPGPCLVQEMPGHTTPDYTTREVRILCGAHAVEISAIQSGGSVANSINVDEIWRIGPPRY